MRPAARAVLVCLIGFAVPAFGQGLFDDNEARRRIEALRQQVSDGQRLVEERLAKIEAAVGSTTEKNAVLELASQIDTLRGEIARMRGQLEVATHQVEVADKRQKDLYLDIDTRLRKLEQSQEQA